jgi:regulator of ribonuclease activity B
MIAKFIKWIFGKAADEQGKVQDTTGERENWLAFRRYSGEDYSLILINSDLIDQNQIYSMCWYELKYHFLAHQLVNGWMPTPEISSAFYAFEEEVEQDIKVLGGLMAASQTGSGVRRVLYCAPNLRLEDYLHKWANAYDNIPVECRPASYPQFENLMPTNRESTIMQDERILENLQKEGDDGSAEREVMHWITQSDDCDPSSLHPALESLGYEIKEATEDFIRFSHTTSISSVSIRGEREKLEALCRGTGCSYDGWETPVVRSTRH